MTHQNTYIPMAAGSYLQQLDGRMDRLSDDDALAETTVVPAPASATAPAPINPKTVATKEQ